MAAFDAYLDEFNRNWDVGLEYRKHEPLPCLPAEDNVLTFYNNLTIYNNQIKIKHTLAPLT